MGECLNIQVVILLLRISVLLTLLYDVHCFFSISIIVLYMMVGPTSFSDGHSVLEMVLVTGPIVTKDIPCHMKPSVKRTVVRWESNKKNEFKDAICNSTEDYERVSTSLDYSLSNVTDATDDSVDTIVTKCSMLKIKSYGKINSQNHANTNNGMTQHVVIN